MKRFFLLSISGLMLSGCFLTDIGPPHFFVTNKTAQTLVVGPGDGIPMRLRSAWRQVRQSSSIPTLRAAALASGWPLTRQAKRWPTIQGAAWVTRGRFEG